MWGKPVASIGEWLVREARYVALDAVLPRPEGGYAWIGEAHPLDEESVQFLSMRKGLLGALVLKEWPRVRQASHLLPELVPAFIPLFADIEEVACVWPAGASPEVPACLLVRRTHAQSGESRFLLFRPGASVEEIALLEAELRVTLPDVLRALYSTFGHLKGGGAALHEGLIGLRPGLGLGHVVGEQAGWHQWLTSLGEGKSDPPACDAYLPIYANGSGDLVLWSCQSARTSESEVWSFFHETFELLHCAPDVATFLEQLLTTVYLGEEEYWGVG